MIKNLNKDLELVLLLFNSFAKNGIFTNSKYLLLYS